MRALSVEARVRRAGPPLAGAALAGAVALLLAAPAAHATYVGTAADPAGDATDPSPARDVVAAGVGYDPHEGTLRAEVRLRGSLLGSTGAFLSVVAATPTASGCGGAALGLGASTDSSSALWTRFADPTTVVARGSARHRGSGLDVQRLEVTDAALRGMAPGCAFVTLSDPADPAVVHDALGPFPVTAYPGLRVALGSLPGAVRPGRRHVLKVTVTNPGSAPTGRVRVRVGRVRGLTASPRTASLGSVAPGSRRTVTVRVALSRRSAARSTVPVTATAGRLSATADRRVDVRLPGRRPAPSGGSRPPLGSPSVCTRWFPDLSGASGGSLSLTPCER